MTMGFVKCSAMIVCGILYFLDCDKLTWHIEIEECKIEVYTSSILKMHFILKLEKNLVRYLLHLLLYKQCLIFVGELVETFVIQVGTKSSALNKKWTTFQNDRKCWKNSTTWLFLTTRMTDLYKMMIEIIVYDLVNCFVLFLFF